MINLLYNIGGFNINVVKAGNLSRIKYLIPGISLLLVIITSFWGGYHLAAITVNSSKYQIPFSLVFVILIFIVDFILLHSNKNGFSAFLRILLSFSLGTLVSVLTLLSIYNAEITAKLSENLNSEIEAKMNEYDSKIKEADNLKMVNDSLKMRNNELAGRELYLGNPEIGSPPGDGIERQRYLNNAILNQDISEQNKKKSDSLKSNKNSYKKKEKELIEMKQLKGLNGRVQNLFLMAKTEPITWFPLLAVFLSLFVIDLMPLTVKFGMMDELESKYNDVKQKLETDNRFYNSDSEKYFINLNEEKTKLEAIKKTNDLKENRILNNVIKVEEAKKLYATNKLENLIQKIKDWKEHSSNQSNNK